MSPRAGCQLISVAGKELTANSDCSGKQRHGVNDFESAVEYKSWLD